MSDPQDPVAIAETVTAGTTTPPARGSRGSGADAAPPPRIGRFVALETLGHGGMGVVIAAYDPALDRKVAIKLLHGDRLFGPTMRGRAQLVAEAQAMARLSHPNVIPVHEIVSEEGTTFLVMEYVPGPTLRGWLATERSWREVLAMFLGAGQGLVAAHREGIVHRDFKPENVLVDRDGRARVGDFGLAAMAADGTTVTASGSVAGTVKYMAPEQLRGEPCDARADQFSYCVALWEAVHGTRPFDGETLAELAAAITEGRLCEPARKPPDWVRAALLRGLQADPAARWPSLEALLDALRRDPRALRRRIAIGVGLAVLAGLLWAIWPSATVIDPCAGATTRLAGVWDGVRRAQVHTAFTTTGLAYAGDTSRRVTARLDSYAASWARMSEDTCRATRVEGRQSDTLMDLRMGCLEQRRGVLGALSSLWSRGVDGEALAHAIDAASSLAPVSECADTRALSERAPMPSNPMQLSLIARARTQLDALQALTLAHRFLDAKRAAIEARAAADSTGWAPIRAEQAFAEGELLSLLGEPDAEPRLLEANRLAEAARDDRLRARALISLVDDLADHQQKADAALRVADLADGAVMRLADDDALRGRLLRVRGKALFTAGNYGAARAMFAEARTRLVAALGAADVETVATVADLASTAGLQGDHAVARQLDEENLAVAIAALGADHPQVAALLGNLATVLMDIGDFEAAARTFRRALAIDEKAFGRDSVPTAATLHDLGKAEIELDHVDEGRRLTERALAIRERTLGPDHPSVAVTLGNLALLRARQHQFDAALADLERALAIKVKAYGPSHSKVAATHEQIAQTLERKGDLPRALDAYRRAADIRTAALGPDHALTLRAVGQVGQALAQLDRCREAGPSLARAIDGLTRSGLEPNDLADVLVAAAGCDLAEHQPAQALARLERATAVTAALDPDPASRGHVDWLSTRALWALGRRTAAIAAARKAEQELAGDPDSVAELAATRAWLAAHPPGR